MAGASQSPGRGVHRAWDAMQLARATAEGVGWRQALSTCLARLHVLHQRILVVVHIRKAALQAAHQALQGPQPVLLMQRLALQLRHGVVGNGQLPLVQCHAGPRIDAKGLPPTRHGNFFRPK